jgi:hypothetical protein
MKNIFFFFFLEKNCALKTVPTIFAKKKIDPRPCPFYIIIGHRVNKIQLLVDIDDFFSFKKKLIYFWIKILEFFSGIFFGIFLFFKQGRLIVF